MEFVLHPWHLLVLTSSALINHKQQKAIEYLEWRERVKIDRARVRLDCISI